MATVAALRSPAMARWLASVHETAGNGPCRGDGYSGYGNYTANGRCPNGLTWRDVPAAERWYRERVERARRFIAEWDLEQRVRATADGLSEQDVQEFIAEVTSWVKSLRERSGIALF
jgi:hypothetical protein